MSVGENLSKLGKEVADLYKELVTNSVKFDELRRQTTEVIGEFKHALERMADKVDSIQQEHLKSQASLRAEVQVLQARLDMLSERALHIAVRDAARDVAEEHLQKLNSDTSVSADLQGPGISTLPPGARNTT